jgi:translation initiation factor 4G
MELTFVIQDVIELHDRKWVTHNLVAAPAMIAQIHEAVRISHISLHLVVINIYTRLQRRRPTQESYQHQQINMSRGRSQQGGDRGSDFAHTSPDGWAVASGSGPPHPPKAGDLMNFSKITKATPMTFGPSSVFAGKKDVKWESLSCTNSSSNMFLMLSQNIEVPIYLSVSIKVKLSTKSQDKH